MKKILSLVSLLMMTFIGMQAQGIYAVKSGDAGVAAGTTVTSVDNITFTWGVDGGAEFKGGNKADNALKDVLGATAYCEGNGQNGALADGVYSGTVYLFSPAIAGKVTVGIVLNAGKSFFVKEGTDGTDVAFDITDRTGTAVTMEEGKVAEKLTGGLVSFDVVAGKTYAVYCTGSKLGFYGFKFEKAAEPEPVADGPIVLWENGETSTLDGYTYITIPASQLKDVAKAKDTIRVTFATANVEARQATPARNIRKGEIGLWFDFDEIKTISEINRDTTSVDFILKAADVEKLAAAESVSLKYKYLTVAKVEFVSAVAVPEPEPVDLTGKLVIGKVFYAGSIRLNGATPKNYLKHLYIELFNNSAETIDVAGTYIALANSDSPANAWTATAMAESHPDSAVVKQIFQIPATSPVELEAGKSIVIANCAIDHSEIAEGNVDLSTADFEVKSTNNAYNDHNENVPALTLVKTVGTTSFINMLNPGPNGIVLLPANTDLASCPETYAKDKTSGNLYTIVPLANSIDCVDIVKQKTPSADDKRFAEAYDAGFTCTLDINTFNCQAVARKVVSAETDARKVLQDTNNSSDDFETLSVIAPRVYGEGVVTVGITNVSSHKVADVEIYNLQGVRMSQLQKGVNIVNGKKVVIK